jgi:hypothetical protein
VHQCHVFRRPGIQTVEVFGRLDRPFQKKKTAGMNGLERTV